MTSTSLLISIEKNSEKWSVVYSKKLGKNVEEQSRVKHRDTVAAMVRSDTNKLKRRAIDLRIYSCNVIHLVPELHRNLMRSF